MRLLVYTACLAYLAAVFFQSCQPKEGERQEAPVSQEILEKGKALAMQRCIACHLMPDPSELDRLSWELHVMPEMAKYYGFHLGFGAKYGPIPKALADELSFMGTVPEKPVMPLEDWLSIVSYFVESAPLVPKKPANKQPIAPDLDGFSVAFSAPQPVEPGITLLQAAKRGGVWFSDAAFNGLAYSADGIAISSRPHQMDGVPVSLLEGEQELFVLTMGNFTPENEANGKLHHLRLRKGTTEVESAQVIMGQLHRPVHLTQADLNADGRPDFIVSEFGAEVGRLSWLENTGNGQYHHHTISRMPGATNAWPIDYDQDGRTDIMALFGQGREGIFVYLNQGNGKFREKELLRFPPTYGSVYFELADFNADGHPDILYCAGDNADYPVNPPRLKPYHGIRIYLNDGRGAFQEAFYFQMNGVYKAKAVDFNGDGKLDIAAVAYFADFYDTPEEGFVLLTQKGDLSFEAATFRESTRGRWLTLEVAHLNEDRKPDIILGAALAGFNTVPPPLEDRWMQERRARSVLINELR